MKNGTIKKLIDSAICDVLVEVSSQLDSIDEKANKDAQNDRGRNRYDGEMAFGLLRLFSLLRFEICLEEFIPVFVI